jgi:hypothetical protein
MINNVVKNLLHTNIGKIILSVLLGLGLATLFRQICNSKDCYKFIGPKHNELRDKIFASDSEKTKCYSLVEENITCGSKSKTLDYSTEFS